MRDAMLRGVWSVALCLLWPFWFLAALAALSVRPSSNLWPRPPLHPRRFSRATKSELSSLGKDNLSGEYELDQAGQISVPLAGNH